MKGPVIFDRENGSISLNLPDNALEYGNRLVNYLQDMFAFEGLTSRTVSEMNRTAIEWLKSRGIHADWDPEKENADGN